MEKELDDVQVFFFTGEGERKEGIVLENSTRWIEGVRFADVKLEDNGKTITLPTASMTRVGVAISSAD